MALGNNFSEEDKEKFVQFLNFVAANAKFNVDTNQIVKYFGLLSHMQQKMLPKIKDNILEIEKVVEPSQEDNKE